MNVSINYVLFPEVCIPKIQIWKFTMYHLKKMKVYYKLPSKNCTNINRTISIFCKLFRSPKRKSFEISRWTKSRRRVNARNREMSLSVWLYITWSIVWEKGHNQTRVGCKAKLPTFVCSHDKINFSQPLPCQSLVG